MKICLINNLFAPYARGGAERMVETIAAGLESLGHEVFIITTAPRKPEINSSGFDVRYLPSGYFNLGSWPKFFRLFWHLGNIFNFVSAWRVRTILKEERPDLVLTHNLLGLGFLVPRVLRQLKIRHCHTLHDVQLLHPSGLIILGQEKKMRSPFARTYQWLTRALVASPQLVVSPSRWLAHEHEIKGFFASSKRLVLQNPLPIQPEIASPQGQRSKVKGQRFRFLYVGQIERHKGILFLIEAFKGLDQDKVELFIAGDGSLSGEAKAAAADSSNVKYLGKVDRETVRRLMLDADCLVVPSLCYENSPTVIHEASALGMPILASALGGIPELLLGAGVLFRPGDKHDFLAKIKLIITKQEAPAPSVDLNLNSGKKIENYLSKLLNT